MQKFLKILRWTSIIFLCLWVLLPILGLFIPLEFVYNSRSEEIYIMIRFYGFPVAAVLSVLTWIKRKEWLPAIFIKIVLAICVAVVSGVITIIALLGNMCAWTTDKVFFENKQNSSIKIVQRGFGCGATDSDYPTYKTFKIREITSDFIWATKIDTNKIDKNEWIRIENKGK